MAKGKLPRSSPAEEYLSQINPDKPFKIYWRRIPSRSDIEPKYRYKIKCKGSNEIPEEPTSRAFYKAGIFLGCFLGLIAAGFLVAGINDVIEGMISGDSYYLAVFIGGIPLLVVIVLFIRDASKPNKRNDDE